MLDAYLLPKLKELVNKMAQYKIDNTIDLKFAYHQVTISKKDKNYTALEADDKLNQFCTVPFGVTNRVACFQRMIDKFIANNSFSHTFAYLNNIIVIRAR